MATKKQEEEWQSVDDEVRENLPPGVKLVRTLRGHTNWIGRIAWSSDGLMLASPSNKTIQLWDAETASSYPRWKGTRKRFIASLLTWHAASSRSGGQFSATMGDI